MPSFYSAEYMSPTKKCFLISLSASSLPVRFLCLAITLPVHLDKQGDYLSWTSILDHPMACSCCRILFCWYHREFTVFLSSCFVAFSSSTPPNCIAFKHKSYTQMPCISLFPNLYCCMLLLLLFTAHHQSLRRWWLFLGLSSY